MNPFRWIWREWSYFSASHVLMVLTLTLGLTGVMIIVQLKEAFLESIKAQERELLSSDLALGARRPLGTEETATFFKKLGTAVTSSYRVIDMSSMLFAPTTGVSRLVEVRVVEPGFPFYGKLESVQGETLALNESHPLFRETCLWLHQEAERSLGVSQGQKLKLGEVEFRHCGTIKLDSSLGFRAFALAPRVYLGAAQLPATKLIGEGAIAAHALHVKLSAKVTKEQLNVWQQDLERELSDPAIRVRRPEDASEQSARAGKIFADYLQLASLVAFILALLGTFYLFRTLMQRRIKDAAVLRALGTSPRRVALALITPLVVDYVIAWPLAFLTSAIGLPLLAQLLHRFFGAELPPSTFPWSIWPVFFGMGLMLISALMPTVLQTTRQPIASLLQNQESSKTHLSLSQVLWGELAMLGLAGLAIWASHSWKIGALFLLGLTGAALGLGVLTWLISRAFISLINRGRLSAPIGLLAGLVLRRLLRRPFTTLLTVLALGLGSVMLSLLGHLELTLGKEFDLGDAERPSLFLFDIQDDQKERLQSFLTTRPAEVVAFSPMVRARLVSVNARQFQERVSSPMFQSREAEMAGRFRRRMMNLTWAEKLNPSERIVAGVPFGERKMPIDEFEISVEERFAERMGISREDLLLFDVLGVQVKGRVVSIKSVKWSSFLPNFFITFAPGALEEAPKSWLAGLRVPLAERAELQAELANQFPNVSSIDVEQMVERLMNLFLRLKKALELMAVFSLVVGCVVVTAMAQDQMIRRQGEVMLEKTLGLSPRSVSSMVVGEFLFLTGFAFLCGSFAGAVIAGVMSALIFEAPVQFSFWLIMKIVGLGWLLVAGPMFFIVRSIYRWRPAGLLQRQ